MKVFARLLFLVLVGAGLGQGQAEPSVVAIVKGDDPNKMVAEAIELIGGLNDLFQDGRTVVIKPNLTSLRGDKPYPGQTTDVRVAQGLVEVIKRKGKCQVSFAEGLNGGGLWEGSGFADLAAKEGITLTNIAAGKFVPVKIDGLVLKEYQFPEAIKQCDVFIDLPVMKTHQLTGITVGMKNLYGLLPFPRDIHHSRAEEVLCDLVQIRKPDLVLVDALVAMEGQGPLGGNSITMNLIVAGRDIVAVDNVCAALMGIDPAQVQHTKLAHERGLGESDLKKIVLKGVPIAEVKKNFKLAKWFIRMEIPRTLKVGRKIASLADKVTDLNSYQGGQIAQFNPERLKVDKAKYPAYESFGFTAVIENGAPSIRFEANYLVPSLTNRQATEDGIKNWIKENLGGLTNAEPNTLPLGG